MMNVGERERRFVEKALMALVEVGLTTVEVDGELVEAGHKGAGGDTRTGSDMLESESVPAQMSFVLFVSWRSLSLAFLCSCSLSFFSSILVCF